MSINKSFSTETSERYARALFDVSKESNELEKELNVNINGKSIKFFIFFYL